MRRFIWLFLFPIMTMAQAVPGPLPSNLYTTPPTYPSLYYNDMTFASGRPWVDVQGKGAKGDGQVVIDAVTNGTTTITSASGKFSPGDVGKVAICIQCGPNQSNVVTTIASYISATSVTLGTAVNLQLAPTIVCTGCTSPAYGQVTQSAGVIQNTAVVTWGGGASGTSATCSITGLNNPLSIGTTVGSGATCTAATGGGVVTGVTVTAGGSGYNAVLYWGTDDTTAIAAAVTAANGGTLFFPLPQKQFYLNQTRLLLNGLSGPIRFEGKGFGSWLVGDPGYNQSTNSLIQITNTPNVEVTGMQISNVHSVPGANSAVGIASGQCTRASGTVTCTTSQNHGFANGEQIIIYATNAATNTFNGTFVTTGVTANTFTFTQAGANESTTAAGYTLGAETLFTGIYCNPCTRFHAYRDWFTGGKGGVYLTSGTQYAEVDNSEFNGLTDMGFVAGGDSTHTNRFVKLHDNFFSNVSKPGLNNQGPHDINIEDTGDLDVHDNYILDNPDLITPADSCIQVANNHYTGTVAHVRIAGNHCVQSSLSPISTIIGLNVGTTSTNVMANWVIEGNTFDGYAPCLSAVGWTAANQVLGLTMKGNTCVNVEGGSGPNGGIYISGPTGLIEEINVEGNILVGPGSISPSANAGPGIGVNRIYNAQFINNNVSNFGLQGMQFNGIRDCIISDNVIYNNSQQSANSYDGIILTTFTVASNNNEIYNNVIYGTNRYGIRVNASQLNNKLLGNTFPGGNTTANIDDENVTTGANNCTLYGPAIGCDNEPVTINSLSATTLVATGFNTTTNSMPIEIIIASECTAVGSSTLQWQVNYTGLNGAISQTGTSHSCASAGQFTDTFLIRSTGATAVTYQAVVANAPAFRDTAVAILQ